MKYAILETNHGSLQMIQCTLCSIRVYHVFLFYLHILWRECDAWGMYGGLMIVTIIFLLWDGRNLG